MNRKTIILAVLSFISISGFSQYWQQKVDYIIDVTLNDKEKTLDGFERITYFNNSPDTLTFIWFHLWPNAYKNDQTAYSHQALENGNTRFYFSSREEKGYINRLDFKVEGITARIEDHPQHIDIIKLHLPKPLPPQAKTIITTPFHVKLPHNFSRGGYDGESFQVSQWYPKPAVYDHKGWHPMPYLDQGEFYSDFGDYDVRINLPENYVVAATGELQGKKGDWMRENFSRGFKRNPDSAYRIVKTTQKKGKTPRKFIPSSANLVTLNYKQSNVHDFAWFADKRFITDHDSIQLPSGRVVHAYHYYHKKQKPEAKEQETGIQFIKDAIRFYSAEVGEYPHSVVSVVEGPLSFAGGMEYPTITLVAPMEDPEDLDMVIAHEVGHNWFQGILASNERRHTWMDEGMNSFYENKYMKVKYGKTNPAAQLYFMTSAKRRTDQPIETHAEHFSWGNYMYVNYGKAAEWMSLIEQRIGKDSFRVMMQEYYRQWSFRHPYPEDFILIAKKYVKDDHTLSLLQEKGLLPNQELSGFTIASPFVKNSIPGYLQKPTKDALLISPAIGGNRYDKIMLGALFTNMKLPPSNFSFLLAPMYATGSKSFTGLGRLNYSIHSGSRIRKTDLFLNGSTFTMNDFRDTADRKLFMKFGKLVPGIRFTFREKEARSTVRKSIQFRSFLIREQYLNIINDTLFEGSDTALVKYYPIRWQNRSLNQLQFRYDNWRALYPFSLLLQVEQAKDFIRPALTAEYFFNYPNGGGLDLRFFAGKFIYLNGKTVRKQFQNDRYHLNMTGPDGYEDYTYSNYFIGRNEFEGLSSQQIMMRDGGFKVRTDLLASKIGKTDNWLTAVNFSSSVPDKINPLSVLPIKIPLKVFFDLGTYAEAWDRKNDADRFLFDAGFQIPLFNEALNIYIPVAYNRVYGDYIKSTIPKNRLFKTISFTINFYNRDMKELNREPEF